MLISNCDGDGKPTVGVITLYYHSRNCGGLLQAYALCKSLESIGYNAQQICYSGASHSSSERCAGFLTKLRKKGPWYSLLAIVKKIEYVFYFRLNAKKIEKGSKPFVEFEKMVSHSSKVYNNQSIECTVGEYTAFITGSDQVWNWSGGTHRFKAYFLNFVPTDVKKVAYAASISCPYIPEELQPFYNEAVERLDAVSLRERSSLELFPEEIRKKIDVVVDPTMLLIGDEWASTLNLSSCPVEGKFIFCYLLDPSKEEVKTIKRISRTLGLPIVMRPNMTCSPVSYDKKLADIPDYDMGPAEFVNYIRNATLVVTNSFHGSVFSILFHTPFFVVKRQSKVSMHSRIESLLGDYGLEERLLEYGFDEALVRNHLDIDWTYVDSQLEKNRKYSMDWLKRALED